MKMLYLPLFSALFIGLMAPRAWADAPGPRGEAENIERRITAVEDRQSESTEPFTLLSGSKYLRLSGLFELAATLEKMEGGDENSELTLATAQLELSAGINENIGGQLVFLYEEVEEGDDSWEIDEAVIHLTQPLAFLEGQLGLHVGRLYVPFGHFDSHFISSPLTQDLGETRDTALYLDYLWQDKVELKGCVFSGDTDSDDDSGAIDTYVLAVEAAPLEGVSFGAAYLSDLAESDIELVQDASAYRSSVPGTAVFASVGYGGVSFEIEYVAALDDFDPALLQANEATGEGGELSGRRPSAWNLELGIIPVEGWEVALKAERAQDFAADARRHGLVVSHGIFRNTALALEYLHSDGRGAGNDPTHLTTAQLAFEF